MDDVLTMYKKQLETDSEYLELFKKATFNNGSSEDQKATIQEWERRVAYDKKAIANLEKSN